MPVNFAQRPFLVLDVLERAWNLRLGTPSLKSLPEDLRPEKNPSTSIGFEPANLGSRGEHVIPRPPIT